uniref:Cytochrome P450 n=1 Tax=Glossina palpalis gambiensis TaxID=67801 RepID=A0A1B0ALV1_9MUSC
MFLAIFIIFISALLLWDYLSVKRRNDMLHYMPGPRALPFVGNAFMYRGQSQEVFSCDPKDYEAVLNSTEYLTKNNLYDLLYGWLGTGLLMSDGKKWHSRRKIITPAFHFKILEDFVEVFDQQSGVMVKNLLSKADGKTPINMYPVVCLAALDIIAETAMGVKINAQQNPQFPYVQAVQCASDIISKRFVKVWLRINWIFRLLAPHDYRRLMESIRLMHEFTEKIIMERRKTLQENLKKESYEALNQVDELGQKKRMALLDVLLQSTENGVGLSNEDIREEVDTFMFEGHDTTTSAISFALCLISRHPEVQQKLFDEIRSVFGDDKDRSVTIRDLGELKYLECVIKESMRLYPPVQMIGRYFNEDVEIRGKRIPANTNFTLGIFIILRDPNYFEDPDVFKPERFMAENIHKIYPYAYIPFSAGPRNCIGQKFALLEMKSTIRSIMLLEIILFVTILVTWDCYKRSVATKTLKNIPIVSRIPFIGSFLILGTMHPDNFHIRWPQFVQRYGKTFYSRIIGQTVVVTVDHRLVDALLSSRQHLSKHFVYHFLKDWLGSGLLLSSGQTWQQMRKIITPTFHFQILEQFIEIFNHQADTFINTLEKFADGKQYVNIYDAVSLLTLDNIAEAAMGVSINAQLNFKMDFVKAVKVVTDIISDGFVRPHLGIPWLRRLTSPRLHKARADSVRIIHQFTERIIRERQDFLLENSHLERKVSQTDNDLHLKKRSALLDVLLTSLDVNGQPLTDKQIRDEVNTFLFEGHDTTSSAISFCLYALSRHANEQQKLFEELHSYFGNDLQRPLNYNDLQQLPYLNCVIKESLRLYPPISAIGRMLDSSLEMDDYTLLTGTNVIILLREMLRDPHVFSNPQNFQPERHFTLTTESSAYSNIPFSAGPRNCIGQRFALNEIRVILIKVLRHYELLPIGPEAQPSIKLILRSTTGINIGLRPRHYV